MTTSDEDMANMISKVSSLSPVESPVIKASRADNTAPRAPRGGDQPTRTRTMENRRRARKSNLGLKFFVSLATLTFIIGMIVASLIYYAIVSQPKEHVSFAGTAVVANGYECADIGRSMIYKGGSAVDAAIATLFCEGVANPESMGLGGGFIMTVYKRASKTAVILNARETAPENAHKNMFANKPNLARKGGLSVAIPGELKGYHQAHARFGRLPWSELVHPTINLCLRGHLVTPHLANILQQHQEEILKEPSLREIYINPKTNTVYKIGDTIRRRVLAKTLHIIAKKGANALYEGELTKGFISDIKSFEGIITAKDLKNYSPTWLNSLSKDYNKKWILHTSPLPSSGVILTLILNILNNYLNYKSFNTKDNLHKMMEAFKFAYAQRNELGDDTVYPELSKLVEILKSDPFANAIRKKIRRNKTFQNPKDYGVNFSLVEDRGTANIAVLAPNGDAVCVTSTINQVFGAGIRSRSTGIILNDEMDDFSNPNVTNSYGLPPFPKNFIAPGKRPMSSMCPSVIVDKNGEVMLVIGSAGGTRITTAVAWVIVKKIWFGSTLIEAITSSRLHHQLIPMEILAENNFNRDLITQLRIIGHKIAFDEPNGFVSVTAISKVGTFMETQFDSRRGGSMTLIKI